MASYFLETRIIMGLNSVETVGLVISTIIGVLFAAFYSYQYIYLLITFFIRPRRYPETDKTKRYAAIIAARNEECVLPGLIQSIKDQTYPAHLIDIYVVADNCTDNTAQVAREMGAHVFERQNKERVGKGYALEHLFDRVAEVNNGFRAYDAYIVFDADNVLRPNYFEEMDKAYCAGNKILTSYRNSKNYGKNWISAGYALWYMHESRHLNNARSLLRSSAAISGTGFLIDSGIIERNNGWAHFLLTEDIEFTVDSILHGDKVGYCHDAELFDEQPETFRQSWRQRKRWAKGFFQVFRNYGKRLFKGTFMLSWSCFDMMMNLMPAFLLSTLQLISTAVLLVANLIVYESFSLYLLEALGAFFVFGYSLIFVFGVFALLSEWRRIHCNKIKAFLLLFAFPVFMITYLPISICALFSHVEWLPIQHKNAVNISDIEAQGSAPILLPKKKAEGQSEPENGQKVDESAATE